MKKTVFITGANRGLGFELARQCGKAGFDLIISGRTEVSLNDALKALRKEKINVSAFLIDVSKQESINKAVSEIKMKNIRFDILVNNAAIISNEDLSLSRSKDDIFMQTMITNSFAPLWMCKSFLPFLRSPGKIIMLSSSAGAISYEGSSWAPVYCISKNLLNTITRQLAFELKDQNISVNAVCPGWVKTDMGGKEATRSLEKGVETPLWIINELSNNVTGKFFFDKNIIDW